MPALSAATSDASSDATSDAPTRRPREQRGRPGGDLGSAFIRVRGARTHNLKNIDLDIPRNKLVVITGPVGLGQVEPRVRHALRRRPAPLRREPVGLCAPVPAADGQARRRRDRGPVARDLDRAEGDRHNPRSTVGTVTEIHDYLRLLFARAGTPYCPDHDLPLQAQTRLPDGRCRAGAAPRHAPDGPGAGGARPQGRVRRAVRRDAGAGLRALSRRRPDLRLRRPAQAEEGREARHRRRDRPPESAPRRDAAAAPGRKLRGGAAPGRGPRPRAGDGRAARRAPVQRQVRLPDLPLLAAPSWSRACSRSTRRWAPARAATASAPSSSSTRSASSPSRRCRLASGAIKGWDRRNALLLRAARERRARTTSSTSTRPSRSCPPHSRRWCCTARARRRSSSPTRWTGAAAGKQARRQGSTRSKASCPNMERRYRETDSAAVREELARYRSVQPCPACDGTRLRREARHVFLVESRSGEQRSRSTEVEPHHAAREPATGSRTLAAARRQGGDRRQGRARDRHRA